MSCSPGLPRAINTKLELVNVLQKPETNTSPTSHVPAHQQLSSAKAVLTSWNNCADMLGGLPGTGTASAALCVKAHLDREEVIEGNSAYEDSCSFESTNFLIMCYSSGGILDVIFFDIFMTHASVEQSKLQFANASVHKFETG